MDDDVDFEEEMRKIGATQAANNRGRVRPIARPKAKTPQSKQVVSPEVRRAEAALTQLREQLKVQESTLVEQRRLIEELTLERHHAELASKVLAVERDERDKHIKKLEARLARVQRERRQQAPVVEPAAPITLEKVLSNRGLLPEEFDAALRALLTSGSSPKLLDAFTTETPELAQATIESTLSLVCSHAKCEAQTGVAIFEVEPARCDVCGGSTTTRSIVQFAKACRRHGLARIRFVGGSPNYRRQLRDSFATHAPALKTKFISGTGRRTKKDAAADVKHSDLVVVWGRTILDHCVSNLYEGREANVITVVRRGIATMLAEVVSQLDGRRQA